VIAWLKSMGGVLGITALIAGIWWLVGVMLGVAYLGFKMVTG
jgi:hypothetical protein